MEKHIQLAREWLDLMGKRESLMEKLSAVNSEVLRVSGELHGSLKDANLMSHDDYFAVVPISHEDKDCIIRGKLLCLAKQAWTMRFRWQNDKGEYVADRWAYPASVWSLLDD